MRSRETYGRASTVTQMEDDGGLDQGGGRGGSECAHLHLVPREVSSPWNFPYALHSCIKTKQNLALQLIHVSPVTKTPQRREG